MKNLILILTLFFSLLLTNCIQGQNKVVYPFEVFSEITLNDKLSIVELSNTNLNSENLTTYLGTPNNEECIDFTAYSRCTLFYDGLTFEYSDRYGSFDFDSANLSNSIPNISYEGTNIKVGDNINLLSSIFQEAYQQRGTNANKKHTIRLGLIDTSLVIEFVYNESSDSITEINISQSNV